VLQQYIGKAVRLNLQFEITHGTGSTDGAM
jgi:hypothetical protein